jgi:hypothetical protein
MTTVGEFIEGTTSHHKIENQEYYEAMGAIQAKGESILSNT